MRLRVSRNCDINQVSSYWVQASHLQSYTWIRRSNNHLAHFLAIQWANVGRIVANHNFILYNVVYYAKIHVSIDFENYTWIRYWINLSGPLFGQARGRCGQHIIVANTMFFHIMSFHDHTERHWWQGTNFAKNPLKTGIHKKRQNSLRENAYRH